MFILIWLIVWLCCDTPSLHDWNKWVISLIVCVLIQLLSSGDE